MAENMNERLNDVVYEVIPVKNSNYRARIFEISTKLRGLSRATEVDKNTGYVYWENKTRYSACNGTKVEEVESFLIRSQMDRLILAKAGVGGCTD